jgi:hypothetical protein
MASFQIQFQEPFHRVGAVVEGPVVGAVKQHAGKLDKSVQSIVTYDIGDTRQTAGCAVVRRYHSAHCKHRTPIYDSDKFGHIHQHAHLGAKYAVLQSFAQRIDEMFSGWIALHQHKQLIVGCFHDDALRARTVGDNCHAFFRRFAGEKKSERIFIASSFSLRGQSVAPVQLHEIEGFSMSLLRAALEKGKFGPAASAHWDSLRAKYTCLDKR